MTRRSRRLARTRQRIKSFVPKTALEKTLYAFYEKWMKWFDDEDKVRVKVFPEDEDADRSEEFLQWSREYGKAHPKPKVPKALLIDFNDRRLGSSLGARLQSGYYQQLKAVVVNGEYGTGVWLIKKHADFGSVAVELVTKLDTVFVAYPCEHEERPPAIDPAVLAAIPPPYRDELAKKNEEDIAKWIEREKGIARAERINKLVGLARGGNQVAAANLIYDLGSNDYYYGEAPKIEVLEFENLGAS